MRKRDEQDARIEAILGKGDCGTFDDALDRFYQSLSSTLELPCEVTGTEDFNWEEPYVFGAWDPEEYKRLRESQPSYEDRYDLLSIEKGVFSEWMLFGGEDLGARVRRRSDGKEFILGLAELMVVNKRSANFQLLEDYAVWFVNSR